MIMPSLSFMGPFQLLLYILKVASKRGDVGLGTVWVTGEGERVNKSVLELLSFVGASLAKHVPFASSRNWASWLLKLCFPMKYLDLGQKYGLLKTHFKVSFWINIIIPFLRGKQMVLDCLLWTGKEQKWHPSPPAWDMETSQDFCSLLLFVSY